MIIRAIRLRNIRSHVSSEIPFKEGINVIIGNTGSGKSSILMGIEYALFGKIGEGRGEGKMLLRHGSRQGSVELEIQEGDDVFKIRRGLKRTSEDVRNDDAQNSISKNGKDVDILNRAMDLSFYMKNLFGISTASPIKVFEAITYIKQDELKELIFDTGQEKQTYIDGLLQVDRYAKTYEWMRDLLSAINKDVDVYRAQQQLLIGEEKAIELEEKIVDLRTSISSLKASEEVLVGSIREKEEYTSQLEKDVSSGRELRLKHESLVSKLNEKKEEIIRLNKQAEENLKIIKEKEADAGKYSAEKERELTEKERALSDRLSSKNIEMNSLYHMMSDLESKYNSSSNRLGQIEKELSDLTLSKNKLKERKEVILRELPAAEKRPSADEIGGRIKQIQDDIKKLEKEKEDALISKTCPYCGAHFEDPSHIASEFGKRIGEYEVLLKEYEGARKTGFASAETMRKEMEVIDERLAEIDSRVSLLLMEKEGMDLDSLSSSLKRSKEEYAKAVKETSELNSQREDILKELDEIVKFRGIADEIKVLRARVETLNESIVKADEEIYKVSSELNMLQFNAEDLERKEKTLKETQEELNRAKAQITTIKREIELKEETMKEYEEEMKKIKEQMEKKEEIQKKLSHEEKILERLNNLREDIRSIREYVRNKFLSDFRSIFRERFYEIRSEADYDVDIDNNYNVVISASNEIFESRTLSGGEKTSVALAYRIALSAIVSRLGGISRNELLIMDEPTSGLDKEDVNALASSITKISGINQIIIVTHDDTLKGIADRVISVDKVEGKTNISVSDF